MLFKITNLQLLGKLKLNLETNGIYWKIKCLFCLRMNAKRFVKNLVDATGETKAHKIMLNCYKDLIRNKLLHNKYTLEIIGTDLKNFLKWLSTVKKINARPISSDLLKIDKIDKDTDPENIRDFIDSVFDKHLKQSNIILRVEYNVLKILNWMNTTQGISNTNAKNELKKYLRSFYDINDDIDVDTIFETINNIFVEYFNKDYDFYDERFKKSELKWIELKIKQANVPKFEIINKYNEIRGEQIVELKRKVEIIGKGKGGKKLAKTDVILQGGLDSTLKTDYENLDLLGSTFGSGDDMWDVKKIWENQVFKYIRNNKLKPRTVNRNSLYIYTIFLVFKNVTIEELEEIAVNNGLEVDTNSVSKKGYAVSELTKMIGKGYMTQYKEKLEKYLNPTLDIKKVITFLKDNEIPSKNISDINKKINSLLGSSFTERKRNEAVYKVLKDSNLRDYGIKITRNLITDILQN